MKYMKGKQLKAGVLLSYGSTVIKTITTLVYVPIILRILGQSEYGLYQLIYSTVSYLSLLSFGLTSSYIRFFAKEESDSGDKGIARLNGLFMIVMCIIAIIACVAGIILSFNIDLIFKKSLSTDELAKAKILMFIAVINVAVKFPSSVFSCYIAAHEHYAFQRGFLLVSSLLEPILTIPFLLIGAGSLGIIMVLTALSITELLFYMIYSKKELSIKFDFNRPNFILLKEIYIFSFFVFLSNVTTQLNLSVDKFLLGIYKGTVSVAVYSLASQVNTMFCTFGTTISSVFIPRVNKLVVAGDKRQDLNMLFIKVGRIQFEVLMLIFTGFVLLGKPFINVWAGFGYSDSYYIAIILLFASIPAEIQNLGIQIMMAMNKHKFRSVCYFFIAVCNLIISIPLCKKFGPIGSAFGTALALLLGTWIIMNIYYHKKIGLNIIQFWKSIGRISVIVGISYIIGSVLVSLLNIITLWQVLLIAILYTFIYGILIFFFALDDFEKEIIISAINKFKKIFYR